jgi:hypothetical protein
MHVRADMTEERSHRKDEYSTFTAEHSTLTCDCLDLKRE